MTKMKRWDVEAVICVDGATREEAEAHLRRVWGPDFVEGAPLISREGDVRAYPVVRYQTPAAPGPLVPVLFMEDVDEWKVASDDVHSE